MLAIFKRELRSYFTTPTGYVFAAIFLCASGFLFAFCTLQMQTADVSSYFQFLMYAYIVIIPLLTMRSFSEEKKSGTEQQQYHVSQWNHPLSSLVIPLYSIKTRRLPSSCR